MIVLKDNDNNNNQSKDQILSLNQNKRSVAKEMIPGENSCSRRNDETNT